MTKLLIRWLPLGVVVTILIGTFYVMSQQIIRQAANDPQIQLSEDTALALADGQTPETLVGPNKVDIGISLAPYIIIYDDKGKVLASSGLLHSKIPDIPKGVLESARTNTQNRVTWQPESGVRSAIVVTHNNKSQAGFVVAGRSLRESENRQNQLLKLAALGWLLAIITTFWAKSLSKLPKVKK